VKTLLNPYVIAYKNIGMISVCWRSHFLCQHCVP